MKRSMDYLEVKNPVTMYYEIRISEIVKEEMMSKIDDLINKLENIGGYISTSLKQMTGESTMVKNFPESLKGVLSEGYINNKKVPLFYSLFVRFENLESLDDSNIKSWFDDNIKPLLFIYNNETIPATKTSLELEYYSGMFITVAAGNRNGIFTTQKEICDFLKNKSDEIEKNYITVSNHVMVENKKIEEFSKKIEILLNIAQETFRPSIDDSDYNPSFPNGQAGSLENHYYRNAVTTEILQNISFDGKLCSYMFHGVWESVYDHENSHIDKRFLEAVIPVVADVIIGPVEPFYRTIKQG